MRQLVYTTKFKSDLKRCKKRNKDITKIKKVIEILEIDYNLPFKYKDHLLVGIL